MQVSFWGKMKSHTNMTELFIEFCLSRIKMNKTSKISFQYKWLQMQKYKSWISKVPRQPFKAKCKLCMKEFDVGDLGKSSFDSHISAKKRK